MLNTPVDLSQHFNHQAILASAGISVKSDAPDSCRCPLCDKGTLFIYPDPETQGRGLWLSCQACSFVGDTLDLWIALRKFDSIEEAISGGLTEQMCKADATTFLPGNIDNYKEHIALRRRHWREAWKTLRATDNDQALNADEVSLLISNKLWTGAYSETQAYLKHCMAAAAKSAVKKTLGWNVIPKKGFNPTLVMGMEDVPGRLCAFQFTGLEERETHFSSVRHSSLPTEGGLSFMELIPRGCDDVIAVDDPGLTLHMQKQHLLHNNRLLPVVYFNEHTSSAWQHLSTVKTILWPTRQVTWVVFQQARQAINGHLMLGMTLDENACSFLEYNGLPELLHRLRKNAKPWVTALAQWLLHADTTTGEALDVLNRLQLSGTEKAQLISATTQDRRRRLENLLRGGMQLHQVNIAGKIVMDSPGGWVIVGKDNVREIICDVRLNVTKEICVPTSKKIFLNGQIHFKGKVLPFTVDYAEVSDGRRLDQWLRYTTAAAGLGMPVIHSGWEKHMLSIAKAFSPPKASVSDGTLGLRADGDFILPRFALSSGDIYPNTEPSMQDSPALDIAPPIGLGQRRRYNETTQLHAWTALASFYILNQLRKMRFMTPYSIAIGGGRFSAGHLAAKQFTNNAGMNHHVMTKHNPSIIQKIKDMQQTYQYPTVVEPMVIAALPRGLLATADNVYLLTDAVEAAAAGMFGFARLVTPVDEVKVEVLPGMDVVLAYLMTLQKLKYQQFDLTSLSELTVIREFVLWFAQYSHLEPAPFLEKVQHALLMPAVTPGFLDSLFEMIDARELSTKLGTVHSKYIDQIAGGRVRNNFIIVDENNKLVHIPRWVVSDRQDRVVETIAPSHDMVTHDLKVRNLLCPEAIPGYWTVTYATWQQTYKAWRHHRTSAFDV